MYIAGLNLEISPAQLTEGIVWGTTVFTIFGGATASAADAKKKGGLEAEWKQMNSLGKAVTPLYGASVDCISAPEHISASSSEMMLKLCVAT